MSGTFVDPPAASTEDRCWLKWKPDDSRPRMKWGMRSNKSITIDNLTEREVQAFEGFLNGTCYVKCEQGRLFAYDVHETLPDPVHDPLIAPHFDSCAHKQLGGMCDESGWHSPGIAISHLGAGRPDSYRRSAQQLTECGFDCLRSRRGPSGQYWEQWVLHSLWRAQGPLRKFMDDWKSTAEHKSWRTEVDAAARFIAVDMEVSFGTLDIVIQRWALTVGD